MFHGKELNRNVNHIHEKSLHVAHKGYNSTFNDLPKKDNSVCDHRRKIQSLTSELFKVKGNFPNTTMSDIFPTRVLNYNLSSRTDFLRNTANTTKFGLNSLKYFASKVCSMRAIEIKNSLSLGMFKNKISNCEPNNCDYKTCQDY